jgi:hypothetical protein
MRKRITLLLLALIAIAPGCRTLGNIVIECAVDAAFDAAFERPDRSGGVPDPPPPQVRARQSR